MNTVVVAVNKSRPFTHALTFGDTRRTATSAAVSGFFVLHDDRQGALADGLHGLNPRNTAHRYTPVQKATSVSLATGKAHSISGGKLGCVYKRTNSSRALGAIFVIDVWSEPGEGGLIHPRYNYV